LINTDTIENADSLGIMHSVLCILNLLLDNLNMSFASLSKFVLVKTFFKFIKKSMRLIKIKLQFFNR
jgi:hypothetical protein